MDKVAVVILNYNGWQFLQKFLPGVIQHSTGAAIYVADNMSTDQSVEFLKRDFPSVNLLQLPANNGYAGGYNEALGQIKAKYYVLLNSDIEVTDNWLSPIIDFMEADEHVAACQPKILDYNKKDHFEYAGAAGGFLDKLGYPYCRGRIFDTLERDQGQYDSNKQVFWATGACLFIRSDVFHDMNGFDEHFFAHMEEIDLCWRINMSGKRIHCVPESKVYHVGGGTLSKSNPRKTYLNFRNHLVMIYKNTPASSLLWKFPIKSLLDIVAAFKLWKDDSFQHFLAVFKAYIHFFTNLTQNNRKRHILTTIRKNTLSQPLSGFFIPVQYYLLGRKKYSQLYK